MFALIRRDLERYFALDGDGARSGLLTKLHVLVDSPGLHGVLVYRFGSWIKQKIRIKLLRYPLNIVYFALDKLIIILWGIHIDQRAEIGGGLYVGHFSGVLIGPAKIGRDCNFAHHVTIGRRADGRGGLPVLGDRVWIGVGAVIFGGISIGDGVTIGPATVVARNLPPRALVIGNPMRILSRDHDNSMEIYGRSNAEPFVADEHKIESELDCAREEPK